MKVEDDYEEIEQMVDEQHEKEIECERLKSHTAQVGCVDGYLFASCQYTVAKGDAAQRQGSAAAGMKAHHVAEDIEAEAGEECQREQSHAVYTGGQHQEKEYIEEGSDVAAEVNMIEYQYLQQHEQRKAPDVLKDNSIGHGA